MKKELIALLAISGIAIMFLIKSSQPSSTKEINTRAQKVLNWNLGSEVVTLDPGLNKDLYGGSIINNLYEGLFRYKDKAIVPALAESYDLSEDGLNYTINLKKTTWSDGAPLTAHDFEYAWKRVLDPTTASEYAHKLYYLKGAKEYHTGVQGRDAVGVKAIDDYTLSIELSAPTPYFLDLLTLFTYFPTRQSAVESGENGSWAIDPQKAISNGPFILEKYSMNDQLLLSKNPNYWNADEVKLDQIVIYQVSDASTSFTAYQSGAFDIIDSVPLAEVQRLMSEDSTFHAMASLATSYYMFNTTVKPLDDIKVRRALALGIDNKMIVESITGAGEIAATGFTPPGLLDAEGNDFHSVAGNYGYDTYEKNLMEAKRLLEEAGYEDIGDFPEVELSYNTSETNRLLAEAIQEMWKKNLGINARLVNKEWAVFQESKVSGSYEIARGSWFADYADPMSMLELWTSYSPINTSRWSSPEYDTLIEAAKILQGQARFDKLYEAQDILMSEMPVIPIYYFTDLFMISERIKGWDKTSMGVWYFGNIEIIDAE